MLEDVINVLDLSDSAIDEHGPFGTPPAQLVRLVLDQKDKIIRMLNAGMVDASPPSNDPLYAACNHPFSSIKAVRVCHICDDNLDARK